METRFGYDFSRVRVHSDSRAAAALGAKAFASGQHIFFRPGRSPSDRSLLAHELAHVVQQATGEANRLQGANEDEPHREALERRAERQSRGTDHETYEHIRPLPGSPLGAPVLQCDFEEDVLAELRRLPSAEEEGLSEGERRERAGVIFERRARLRALFHDLPTKNSGQAVQIRERLRARMKGDILSERFHDMLATATRRELVKELEGAFDVSSALARVLSGADFCKPFTPAELKAGLDLEIGTEMQRFVNEDIRDFFGDETADLWDEYLTRTPGDSLTPKVFDDPADEIVKAFVNHPDTANRQREIIAAIERNLSGKCPTLKFGVWTDVDVTALLPATELNAPFSFGDPATTIPGLIAGGVSPSAAVMESRSISGKVRLMRPFGLPGVTSVRLRTQLRFTVRDAIDFCPGGKGGPAARLVTVPLSRLEASGMAFAVPFEVHYDGPSMEVELSATAAKACL